MGAETEENVNIGSHPRELKGRPLSQRGAGELEGNTVTGVGPSETKQGEPENTEEGEQGVGDISYPVHVPLNKSEFKNTMEELKDRRQSKHPTLGRPGPLYVITTQTYPGVEQGGHWAPARMWRQAGQKKGKGLSSTS